MTQFHVIILAALALHIVVLATLALLVVRYRRRWLRTTLQAEQAAHGTNGVVRQLTEANGVIRSLEATVADTFRLLTDAQGTIGVLEQRMAEADLQRDVALAASRSSHARIGELELHALDVETQLAVAQQEITDLEARLRLPEPSAADLVLLDAAVRSERLQDAPVAVPEGCRVETVLHRPQTVVRGPGGRFVQKAGEKAQRVRAPAKGLRSSTEDRKQGWG